MSPSPNPYLNKLANIVKQLPTLATPCRVKVNGFDGMIKPDSEGFVLALAANNRVYFPSPKTGEYYPNGWDVTHMVSEVKFG